MKSIEEYLAMTRRESYGLIRKLSELGPDALPIEVEGACYDAGGAITATLSREVDLKKISKRDIVLTIILTTGADSKSVQPYVSRVHRYVKDHFAGKMQGLVGAVTEDPTL